MKVTEFKAGQCVVPSDPTVSKFGSGPFIVVEVIDATMECSCGGSFNDEAHRSGCPMAEQGLGPLVEMVGDQQIVTVKGMDGRLITHKIGNREIPVQFGGSSFKPA